MLAVFTDEKKKRAVVTVSRILLIVLLVVYVIYHVASGFKSALGTTVAYSASEEEIYSCTGYVFRDETVLTSEYGGYCRGLIPDGGLVPVDTEYARVYNQAASDSFLAELGALNERQARLEAVAVKLSAPGFENAMNQISESRKLLADALTSGDAGGALAARDRLETAAARLEMNAGDGAALAAAERELADITERRELLYESLGAEYESFSSEAAAFFFSGTDGLESAYSSRNIADMTLADFENAFSASPEANEKEGAYAFGTIVNSYRWYFAVPVGLTVLRDISFTEGDSYSVTMSDGLTLKMPLERIVTASDRDGAVLVFSSERLLGTDRSRVQQVRILTDKIGGYRVPNAAISSVDGQAGVYILKNGKIRRRFVRVLWDNGLYSIVAEYDSSRTDAVLWLAQNDMVIVTGTDLYDGKTVN